MNPRMPYSDVFIYYTYIKNRPLIIQNLPTMEQLKKSLKAIRNVFLLSTFLACFSNSVFAHRVETFTTSGCASGQTVVVDAIIVAAGGATYYTWQYKESPTAAWKCFTASSVINGQTFTVTGMNGGPAGNDAPTLKIFNATTALEGVLVRVIMKDNGTPCGATSGVYGGDDEAINETKHLRLHIYVTVGDCGGTTPGCIGNLLQTGTLATQY